MEAVLAREPKNERQLAATAGMLMSAENVPAAAMLWDQARAVNPWIVQYWAELASCYARLGRWQDCARICEEALRRLIVTRLPLRSCCAASSPWPSNSNCRP